MFNLFKRMKKEEIVKVYKHNYEWNMDDPPWSRGYKCTVCGSTIDDYSEEYESKNVYLCLSKEHERDIKLNKLLNGE